MPLWSESPVQHSWLWQWPCLRVDKSHICCNDIIFSYHIWTVYRNVESLKNNGCYGSCEIKSFEVWRWHLCASSCNSHLGWLKAEKIATYSTPLNYNLKYRCLLSRLMDKPVVIICLHSFVFVVCWSALKTIPSSEISPEYATVQKISSFLFK